MLSCRIQKCRFRSDVQGPCDYCNLWDGVEGYYDLDFEFFIDRGMEVDDADICIKSPVRICYLCHEEGCPCCGDNEDALTKGVFDLELVKVSDYGNVCADVKCTACRERCGRYEGRSARYFCYSYRFLNGRSYLKHICIFYCPKCVMTIGQKDLDRFRFTPDMFEILYKIKESPDIDWNQDFQNIMEQVLGSA